MCTSSATPSSPSFSSLLFLALALMRSPSLVPGGIVSFLNSASRSKRRWSVTTKRRGSAGGRESPKSLSRWWSFSAWSESETFRGRSKVVEDGRGSWRALRRLARTHRRPSVGPTFPIAKNFLRKSDNHSGGSRAVAEADSKRKGSSTGSGIDMASASEAFAFCAAAAAAAVLLSGTTACCCPLLAFLPPFAAACCCCCGAEEAAVTATAAASSSDARVIISSAARNTSVVSSAAHRDGPSTQAREEEAASIAS